MKNFSVEASWTQPYRTQPLLWEMIETQSICEEMEKLESQLRTTSLAVKMLKDIGVNVK